MQHHHLDDKGVVLLQGRREFINDPTGVLSILKTTLDSVRLAEFEWNEPIALRPRRGKDLYTPEGAIYVEATEYFQKVLSAVVAAMTLPLDKQFDAYVDIRAMITELDELRSEYHERLDHYRVISRI